MKLVTFVAVVEVPDDAIIDEGKYGLSVDELVLDALIDKLGGDKMPARLDASPAEIEAARTRPVVFARAAAGLDPEALDEGTIEDITASWAER